jgi:CRP/FNR family cyclic AMP-dependent transcriptional regulator
MLFQEGDRGVQMYVIRTGKVNIWKRIGETEITLAVLGPGEFFGEMALLESLPRSAGATVLEDATLVEVDQQSFETLIRRNAEVALRLLRRLSSRLREADRQIQALMSRSGAARALSLLKTLAEPPDSRGFRFLPRELSPEQLAARVGLTADEQAKVKETFERHGLLVQDGERLRLGPEKLVMDYLLYLELREQYDPLTAAELAELVGVPEEEAHRIARRVLQARLHGRQQKQPQLVDTYSTYLALKERFEYAEQ